MSNEKQLTPIMEAIKYANKRMEYWETQYECFKEEREFDSARRCKMVASVLNDHIKFLKSLLPKEEESMIMLADKAQQYSCVSGSEDPRVEFYYTPKELFNETFNKSKVCPSCGYPLFKRTFENFERCQGCNETFKTESDATTDTDN